VLGNAVGLRQINTTGNLRMARMRDLPVGQNHQALPALPIIVHDPTTPRLRRGFGLEAAEALAKVASGLSTIPRRQWLMRKSRGVLDTRFRGVW